MVTSERIVGETINAAPSHELLYWAYLGWAKEHGDLLAEKNPRKAIAQMAQIAAEVALGKHAVAHTNGAEYFSIRVPGKDRGDTILLGDVGYLPHERTHNALLRTTTRLTAAIGCHFSDDNDERVLSSIAKNMCTIMECMKSFNAHHIPCTSDCLTVHQLFRDGRISEMISIAAALNHAERGINLDQYIDCLYSAYWEIRWAEKRQAKAFLTLVFDGEPMVMPMSELENPYVDFFSLCFGGYDAADIAAMPISTVTKAFMNDGTIAGLLLSFVADHLDIDPKNPSHLAPEWMHQDVISSLSSGIEAHLPRWDDTKRLHELQLKERRLFLKSSAECPTLTT